jgi:hypothetical protein
MAILKRLDLFRSINTEYKDGTILGALLTFCSIVFVVFFFSREIREYRSQKLATKLYVQNLHAYSIELIFDIVLFKLKCDKVTIGLESSFGQFDIKKLPYEENGCQLVGNLFLKHMDNKLYIRPDIGSTIIDFMLLQSGNEEGENKGIDMSHKINKFQFGRYVSRIESLAEQFPEIVKSNPLDGVSFVSDDGKSGHSMFLYEMNIVTAKIDDNLEIIYNYNKNTITSLQTQPLLNFIMDFSPIAIEYVQGNENFFEFLTYLLGIVGGVLAIIKFLGNFIQGFWQKPYDPETAKVMEM